MLSQPRKIQLEIAFRSFADPQFRGWVALLKDALDFLQMCFPGPAIRLSFGFGGQSHHSDFNSVNSPIVWQGDESHEPSATDSHSGCGWATLARFFGVIRVGFDPADQARRSSQA